MVFKKFEYEKERRSELGSQRELTKVERIQLRKKEIGSKKNRKLRKYSDNFNEMFSFFLRSYRSGLLEFCGSIVETEFDPSGEEGKFCFRQVENGDIKRNTTVKTRHPNIVKGVISGKKSWGLWVDQWSDGIVDWTFTKEEILEEFQTRNIQIPEPLLRDFENRIEKKKQIRNQMYFEMLNKEKNHDVKDDKGLDDYIEFLGSGGMWV